MAESIRLTTTKKEHYSDVATGRAVYAVHKGPPAFRGLSCNFYASENRNCETANSKR